MLLTIDIGNTEITAGMFDGKKLLFETCAGTPKKDPENIWNHFFENLISGHTAIFGDKTNIAACSVVPSVNAAFEKSLKEYFPSSSVFHVTHNCKTNIKIIVAKPESVGTDLIANAVAAYHKYKTHLIVVDLGTATTFQVISADGKFIGSSFFPGLKISAQALFEQAEKLRSIEIKKPHSVIGTNTEECLQSGLYHGYAGMIDAMIQKIEKEYGKKTKVILTGGLANVIVEAIESNVIHEKFLTLEGIKLIWEMNEKIVVPAKAGTQDNFTVSPLTRG